ncbi:MAG TPA: hypothetical protein PL033_09390 [Candidatus Brocadiia bacterium]|nr:hypothetical protein [Candidatus Brocadiia bacterium]
MPVLNRVPFGVLAGMGLVVALFLSGAIFAQTSPQPAKEAGNPMQKVDFSYAFAMPHRMTVALPDSSDKTILDVYGDHIGVRWTYGNLLNVPLAAYAPLGSSWSAALWIEMDGARLPVGVYSRAEGCLPVLDCAFKNDSGGAKLRFTGGLSAALTRVTVSNTDSKLHKLAVVFSMDGSFGEVPGYIVAGDPLDYIIAGWSDAADRVLALAVGGKSPLRKDTTGRTIAMEWELAPGEEQSGWLIRPYRAYERDVARLRGADWEKEAGQGIATWKALLGRAARIEIPDQGVRNSYYACLGDIFIMREPVAGGYIASSPGTEGYRCPNSIEAAVAAICLDQAGLPREAAAAYRMCLDQQGEDGNWADPKGWGHRFWASSGFKAWYVMEHYRLNGDRAYLEAEYPRMLASSRWQEKQRARTRVEENGQRPLTWGLMPRGVGDCGLDAGDGWYGVFIPHNIWAVYGDMLSLEAARILGKTADAAELETICKAGRDALMRTLEEGAIREEGYRWIPASPLNKAGSRWGVLNAVFPCGLLPGDHELITGTLRHMNANLSPGGLQMHTGWMAQGMWVAISLDNIAEAELSRGNGDEFARLLYACLNHGTPLYTWCEERGPEPGSGAISGDRQHLFTPIAVARAVRDALVMEDGGMLHLARGAARHWLGGGEPVGVSNMPTHFGPVSYGMLFDATSLRVSGSVSFPKKSERKTMNLAVLHMRLPDGCKVKSVNQASGAVALPDGSGIQWESPQGKVEFEAVIHAH